MAKYIIGAVVVLLIGLAGGWFAHKYIVKPEIKIVKETKTIYTQTKVPVDLAGCLECYYSFTKITGSIKDNLFTVTAEDACKRADKAFLLDCLAKPKKNLIEVSPILLIGYNNTVKQMDFVYGAEFSYMRIWSGLIGLGGGIIIQRQNIDKSIYAGIKATLAFQF
jgi:hypothetical protein